MRIESVHLRRFRGLENVSLAQCAGMNVLIGRNNAGKSSVLHAIETALSHLESGKIAKFWNTRNRPIDEFTNRDATKPIQIGISFHLDTETISELKQRILSSGAGLEVAVNQLDSSTIASVICAVFIVKNEAILYVQEIGLAPIDANSENLRIEQKKIFSAPPAAATTLALRAQSINRIRTDISSLGQIDPQMIEYSFRESTSPIGRTRLLRDLLGRGNISESMSAKLNELRSANESSEKFIEGISRLKASCEFDIEEIEKSELEESVSVFSGTVQKVPEYVGWLIRKLSNGTVLSFKEIRDAIGRDEASQILKLKTKRGGAEALARVQNTVKSLLGVQVDAFEPESPSLSRRGTSDVQAEMDVDDFLVEANGAGIREALRIILDLELKGPHLAFIEEPEVHLHPGLEKVLHSYLVSKSDNIQLFVATHSANFLDATARQNIYLVSRSSGRTSEVQKVASEGDLLKISEEVGLRPSTVLMFDRLVFVEGPSDEEILTELSRKLSLDIAASSTTFVQMGGASRFAHYAAQETLNLLSRRQIKMWFVIDKDERDDTDVTNLLEKLGNRAELTFLGRREIENYLLFPEAVHALILEKRASSPSGQQPSLEEVEAAINTCALSLLERAIELRMAKTALKPLYPQHGGTTTIERLEAMNAAITQRIAEVPQIETTIRTELTQSWQNNAIKLAPGSEILDGVCNQFGYRYRKEIDGRRLAERIDVEKLDGELVRFLKKIAS